ncbi:MAG: hypothetical protein JO352_07510 [Chloroflexi bacterium]|nr:hypothetical protein [Chloroflexota bacterium]MBV9599989.1 hypothetical protein [Chloroflexota bacterium]
MAAPQRVVQAVQSAIVASAYLAALQHVSAAAEACQRLGRLTSGRWRSAARDLSTMEEDLQTALSSASESLESFADDLGVPEEALWTVGDAAATFDLLRDAALDQLDDDDDAAASVRILEGEVLFGASFVEDPDLPDRGTTLLFGWPDPLEPASWPWQANWVVGDSDSQEDGEAEELDLFENGELEGDETLVAGLADELGSGQEEARTALRSAAMALTRASLLAAIEGDEEEEEEEEDDDNGAV